MYMSKYTPVKSLLIQDAAAVPVMVVWKHPELCNGFGIVQKKYSVVQDCLKVMVDLGIVTWLSAGLKSSEQRKDAQISLQLFLN